MDNALSADMTLHAKVALSTSREAHGSQDVGPNSFEQLSICTGIFCCRGSGQCYLGHIMYKLHCVPVLVLHKVAALSILEE